MKPIAELLQHLLRTDVGELAMASGRPPAVRVAGSYLPVDDAPARTEELAQLLRTMLGAERFAEVGERPGQWALRAPTLGTLTVAAVRRGDVINVRITRASTAAAAAPVPAAAPQAAAAPAAAPGLAGPAAAAARPAPAPAAPAAARPSSAAQQAAAPHGAAPHAAASHAGASHAGASHAAAQHTGAAPQAATPAAAPAAPPRARLDDVVLGATGGASLEALLQAAREVGATDLHLVAGRPPLFRIAGDLRPRGEPLEAAALEALLLPVVPERLRPVLEKDGSADFAMDGGRTGRCRVNVGRQRTGLKGSFRIIPREVPTLESLGLPLDIAKATHHHQGLIVVTGPSGHGKTTTLAALVDLINSQTRHHVLTVEDPVEYVHPKKQALMSQREVGTHTRSFASALKGSLREDPDVIVVGELRDTETVRMALAASETGHLLLATMNTPSAAKTIDRIIDLFPPGDQAQVRVSLSTALRLIVSQRLVPDTSGQGVVAAVEVLPGSTALANLIRDNKTFQIPSLQQRGKSLGIVRFEDSLAELVKSGRTTLERARAFSESPDELEALVTGRRPAPAGAAAAASADEAPAAEAAPAARVLGQMRGFISSKR